MRLRGTVIAAALVLTGCSGPAEGDQVACDRVIGAHNLLWDHLDGADPDRDTTNALWGAIPGAIDDAQVVAEDAELRAELSTLARYVDETDSSNPDDVAWLLQYGTVEKACQDAGVDVALSD